MVAYALALDVPTAHLIYVSGDAISRVIAVPVAGVDTHVHAVRLDGMVDDLGEEMLRLAGRIVGENARSSSSAMAAS